MGKGWGGRNGEGRRWGEGGREGGVEGKGGQGRRWGKGEADGKKGVGWKGRGRGEMEGGNGRWSNFLIFLIFRVVQYHILMILSLYLKVKRYQRFLVIQP